MQIKVLAALVLVAAVAACGTSRTDRAITGAAIGAGVGAAGAAVTGNDLGPSAIVGGLVGAAAGALTSSDQVDLGDPFYR